MPPRVYIPLKRFPLSDYNLAGSSPDRKNTLLYTERSDETLWDIWTISLNGEGRTWPVVQTPRSEFGAALSRDGNWLAFTSAGEVWIASFPDASRPLQVSNEGGHSALWSPDDETLYYRNGDLVMAVSVTTEPELELGIPEVLFEGSYVNLRGMSWDISPDGEQFLMLRNDADYEPPPNNRLNLILNWFEELNEKVPVGR